MASDDNTNYEAELYHAMCRKLWSVVKPDGMNDCASIAADRLTTLEALARAALAECEAWRVRERTMPYLPADTAEQHRCDARLIEAREATDAAREGEGK